jgi:hypothetical protein
MNQMINVEPIQTALLQLPEADLAIFRHWYEEWEANLWDKQIEQDVKSGHLDRFAQEARLELAAAPRYRVMKHLASPQFWQHYQKLPPAIQQLADQNFELLQSNLHHPSLHFKAIEDFWSVRVGLKYRALVVETPGVNLVLDRTTCRI